MRKSILTIIICLISAMLIAGCGAASDSSSADKPEKVEEEIKEENKDDSNDREQPENENKEEEKPSKEDIKITDVSWNHGSYVEFTKAGSDVTEVYFTLSNGQTVTKQLPIGYYVDGKEECDIDGDGEDEIVINQYFFNTIGEYNIVNIYKLRNGEIEEIFPTEDIPELKSDVADTMLVSFDEEGYPKYALDVTILKKDGGEVYIKYHALLAWHNGSWEKIEYGNEEDDDGPIGALPEQEPFFGVWVNAYKERYDAETLAAKLEDKGLPASYVYSCDWENLNKDPYYCVTIGRSGSETEAEAQGLLEDAKKAGFPKAYVKYTGERLGHRVDYTVFDESKIEISPSKAILNDVMVDDLSGDDTGDITLIVDKDTVFDESCEMQFFSYYQDGDSPLEWFNHINDIKDSEEYRAQGGALRGVFEVDVTGNHIDRFYGSYWWD